MNALLNTDDLMAWTGIKDLKTLTSFLNRMQVPYATVKDGKIVSTLASVQQAFDAKEIEVEVELVRVDEVKKLTKLSRGTIYNHMNNSTFPPSVPLGPKSVAWKKVEVLQWIEGKRDWGK